MAGVNLGTSFVSLALASALFSVACDSSHPSSASHGGLVVLVASDLSIPKDIDHVTVDVTQFGKPLLHVDRDIGAEGLKLPAALTIGPTGNNRPVTVHGVASKAGMARIERSAVTVVPTSYLGQIRLPFDYLCDGTADADGASTCPGGQTCKLGTCDSTAVPKSEVTHAPASADSPAGTVVAVDAGNGGENSSAETCFDVIACMQGQPTAAVNPDPCTLSLPAAASPGRINVAIQLSPGGEGICAAGGSACWVVLDEGEGGWSSDGTIITLPPGVCRGAVAPLIAVSTACGSKQPATPVCGDWSSATVPAERPPAPISDACDANLQRACGNCGTQTRTCSDGVPSPWTVCVGEGECKPAETRTCKAIGATETCGADCHYGMCDCSPRNIACAGACVPEDDLRNCGTCGHDCSKLSHVSGATACVSGKCGFDDAACANGFGDCDGDPENGCETDLTTAAHCGSCGQACTGSKDKCSQASGAFACVASCPSSAPAECGKTCSDVTSDAKNCGACGKACRAPSNAQPVCASGVCDISCNAGYSLCEGQCVALMDDPNHCGTCTNACSGGKGCVTGACACPSNLTDCGGVCTDVRSSDAHCGACGTPCTGSHVCQAAACVCPTGQHDCKGACVVDTSIATCGSACTACAVPTGGSATCDGTKCGATCGAGLTVCTNACVNTKTDAKNCGACGTTCNGTDPCVGGHCSCTGICAPGATASCGAGGTKTCSDGCAWGACAGQSSVTTLAANVGPSEIAATSTNVYWIDSVGYQIMTVPIAGGTPTSLASISTPNGITASATNAYWTDGTACDTSTGLPYRNDGSVASTDSHVTASDQLSPVSIAVDTKNVYWLDAGAFTCTAVATGGWSLQWNNDNTSSIMKMPIGGGTPTTLLSDVSITWGDPMATDGTDLYYVDFGLNAVNVTTGVTRVVTMASVNSVVADSHAVYWTQSDGTVNKLVRGGTPVALATKQGQITYLGLDAANLYWSDTLAGTISSVPIGGGPTVVVASGLNQPTYLAIGTSRIFFTKRGSTANNYKDGAVLSVVK